VSEVCVYYCRTYYNAVRGGGRRRVDDMCYDRRRAEACVEESEDPRVPIEFEDPRVPSIS